jgi:exodeoxyribonuclease VII large subunit
VSALRVAGEGDLLAQLAALRRQLQGEGLFEPQKLLLRPQLPRTIGVVTSESGKARDDVLAGLQRRGWAGTLVWGFAPVQDRKAAGAITQALTDLAGIEQIETIIVARGGGSLADLFAFCDETLCRTVALLRVPVIASVGHHTDQTLIDDVAAESCSTPTHAAEAAVPLEINAERAALRASTAVLSRNAGVAVVGRARALAALARVPGTHIARQRRELHQDARELRAAGQRRVLLERERSATVAEVLRRKAAAGAGPEKVARLRSLEGLTIALSAHDPRGVLERGYAMVDDGEGNLITTATQARAAENVRLQFADDSVAAKIQESDD